MTRAEWTYELPPVTGDTVWLEEYLVYDADGEPAGKVLEVLDHGGERYLVLEREHLPLRHDRRAVPFDAAREVDDENLAVHLSLSAAELDAALELDPGKGIEQGGEARRVAETPLEATPAPSSPYEPGPRDRPEIVVSALLLVTSTITLLGAIALYTARPDTIRLVWFAVPVALVLLSVFLAYRAWATPWERGGSPAGRRSRPTA